MKKNYYVLLIYFVLALLFWGIPMNFDFINRLNMSPDPAFYLWSLKWWPYAMSHDLNPFLTKAYWAPFGQNLAWTCSCPSIAIIMWPFTAFLGPIFAYNFITILSLTLAPYGVYLISKQLDLKETSSVFGGLMFFFSSYLWGQLLGHLNLYIIFIVVFLVYLYVLRFKDSIGRKVYIFLYTLLLAFQFGISNEIYATFIVFSFIAFGVSFLLFFSEKYNRSKIVNIVIESVIGVVISIVLLSPYLYYILHGYVKEPLNSNEFYVTDPINYFIPTPIILLFGDLFLPISSKFAGNFSEEGAYLGLPLIGILISYLYLTFKMLYKQSKLYILMVIFFVITIFLSFGPYLRILNYRTIPMPWVVFSHLPFLTQALATRFTLYVELVASVIAAIWFEKINRQSVKYIWGALALLFLIPNIDSRYYRGILANNCIPSFITSGEYKNYIKKNENIVILPDYSAGGIEGPLWQYTTDFYFNLSQQLAGPLPRQIQSSIGYFNPSGFSDEKNLNSFAVYLEKCEVKYVLFSQSYKKYEKSIDKYLSFASKVNSGGVVLYKVSGKKNIQSTAHYSMNHASVLDIDFAGDSYPDVLSNVSGVSHQENWGRWTDANLAPEAKFVFKNPLPGKFTLELKAHAFGPNIGQPIKVIAGGIEKTFTPESKTGDEIFQLDFNGVKGNIIEIVPPKPTSPKDVGVNQDPRKIGVGLVYMKVLPSVSQGSTAQEQSGLSKSNSQNHSFPMNISFGEDSYPDFLSNVSGMSYREDWGRWTDANLASEAKFVFKNPLPGKFTLELKSHAFGPNIGQPVKVIAGGIEKTFTVESKTGDEIFQLDFNGVKGNIIEIIPPKPTSPKDAGVNQDPRKIGVGLVYMKVLQAAN